MVDTLFTAVLAGIAAQAHSFLIVHTKVIDFPRYNTKCSGENAILREGFHVVSCFPLHFM